MSKLDRKMRPRRIAADEAHAWARNLRLNNPNAKLVLSMLSLYVDGDGYCFVGIPTLAEDTEFSAQTVRNRLTWLEQVGAIARRPQWIDENGRRNGECKGRRTSDLIRLMIDVDPDEIEDAAATGIQREIDPIQRIGSDPAAETVDPTPALRRPSDSAQGLTSEPEPESSLKSLPGTSEAVVSIEDQEPEHFVPAWSSWPGHAVMRRDLALTAFRGLSEAQQVHCRAAVPLFAAEQNKLGRTHAMNFHLWIRSRGFEEFPGAKLASAPAATVGGLIEVESDTGRAVLAMYAIAKVRPFESRGRIVYAAEVTPRILALAGAGDRDAWPWIEDKPQIAAWAAFLDQHVKTARPALLSKRGTGEDVRTGIYAPWPWPPRKDGTLSPDIPSSDNSGTVS